MMGKARAIGMQKRGFSLLEVMVALALLALSFTALLLVQGRATSLAVQARTLSIATQLARLQLMECKNEAQKIIPTAGDFKLEGDFKELGFEKFSWECHAPKFNMKSPSAAQMEKTAKASAPEAAKQGMAATQSAMSPIMTLVTDSLGNSVRELAVIVRWTEDNVADEVRVVTHIADLAAMQVLARMLKQGVQTLDKMAPKKPDDKAPGQAGASPPGFPGPPLGQGPHNPGRG